jgi:hypothetical protein
MDSTLVWVFISVGAIAGIALTVALIVANRSRSGAVGSPSGQSDEVMSPDVWISLGTVFTGAGVALWLTIGPAMLGMFVLGMVYLVIGIRKQREAKAGH